MGLSIFFIICSMVVSTLCNDFDSWESFKSNFPDRDSSNFNWRAEQENQKKREAEQNEEDPYHIVITNEGEYSRISFDSLIYKNSPLLFPKRYILVNNLPDRCNGIEQLPYGVFLTGFGAVPENYSIGLHSYVSLVTFMFIILIVFYINQNRISKYYRIDCLWRSLLLLCFYAFLCLLSIWRLLVHK